MKGATSDHACIWCTIHKKHRYITPHLAFVIVCLLINLKVSCKNTVTDTYFPFIDTICQNQWITIGKNNL